MAGRKLNKKKRFFGFPRGRSHGIFFARGLPSRCCVVLVFLCSLAAAQLPNDIIICEIKRCIKEDWFKVGSIQKRIFIRFFLLGNGKGLTFSASQERDIFSPSFLLSAIWIHLLYVFTSVHSCGRDFESKSYDV
ncbi:uncharacterized protein LOC115998236 [Ipomoea triloba]|uniref:uncharacterized protein LOC115998236 n=1 Tax=Ipomoea triloba TaxID=35885 RepID=UPI00125D0B4E|nr:uncharacterized protein LOC115998236 [Ipomoea triloba]XP_031093596.1 uncharacterized protein LOC115998236 [Ipomoea triloba]